jgi:hypothetical protein
MRDHSDSDTEWPERAMSIYAVNYLCREVLRDQAFRAAMPFVPPCLSCRHAFRAAMPFMPQ